MGISVKQRKKSSIQRIINLYRNIDISDIALAETSYQKKDFNKIKKIFNKPLISDKTALAYARIAFQYVDLLANTTDRDKKIVLKLFKIKLTSDYRTNLALLGNISKIIQPPTNWKDIIRLGGILSINKKGNYETSILNPDIDDFLYRLKWVDKNKALLVKHDIRYYRIYLRIKCKSKNEIWVSTKYLKIPNWNTVEVFIIDYDIMIESGSLYDYEDIVEVLQDYLEIVVEYSN